ncbi:carbohydrate kinase family protein [Egibacter rhizosphaerae]|uniref:Carbohydrate kinase family protein n=1 Tax=Egibacter rhizosphaerae TaxID=1670831 RepID=A0A411YJG4_9ACTN|nr:carbohydrate kinase family protein [Egibacter rhizosphaerae]QBI21363.1 carbohydrate kinase family protein [Egibacter rhizosphaerae]
MRIAVSGSIATDYLMSFPGRFTDQLVADQLDRVSLSFLISDLEIRRGGVAANISFGMGQLGLSPLLVGAVGRDFFNEYEPHLAAHGVDTSAVRVSEQQHTAMFLCTTDETEQNQIASFYPGAMSEAAQIDLDELARSHGEPDLVVVCPNDPGAMARHTREALEAGWQVAADPSQQLPRLEGDGVRELVDGATYLLSNDYEAALIEEKSGWSTAEVLKRVDLRVTTYGPQGCVIQREGEEPIEVPVVPPLPDAKLEPTGVGDAFRAGFLAGVGQDLPLERSAQIGSLVATLTLESVGPQEYRLRGNGALDRFARAYGDDAVADAEALLGEDTALAAGGDR